jgi:hypothetical protein
MTGRPLGRRRGERGQATTETILLTWLLLMFMAAMYQLFLVNETLFRSMTTAHSLMMRGAYQANCYQDEERCEWDGGDLRSKVIWRPQDIPEVRVPVVRIFQQRYGLTGQVRLRSNVVWYPDTYKRSKLTSGNYFPILGCITRSLRPCA